MTKDGRPSLINNIRLFAGDRSRYLEGQEEAVAYGRRIAWFLNSEGFSLGAFPELYVLFMPSLESGLVRVTDDGAEWWHRYVHVGVEDDFPNNSDTPDIIIKGIVEALIAVRPDQESLVRRVDGFVRERGNRLRFLLKRREMAKLVIEISFNIEAWPESSYLFIGQIDKATNVYREADPIALGSYMEGFDLVSGIRLEDAANLKEVSNRPMISKEVKRRA